MGNTKTKLELKKKSLKTILTFENQQSKKKKKKKKKKPFVKIEH